MHKLMLLVLVMAGCGGSSGAPDASPPDAQPPATRVRESREIVSGGARLSAGSIMVDVQVGHGVGQQLMSGGSFVVEGAATVKPKPKPRLEPDAPANRSNEGMTDMTERKVAP